MRTLVVVLGLALSSAARDKSNNQPATGSAGSAVGWLGHRRARARARIDWTDRDQVAKAVGTPPKKTTKPLDKATIERLAELEFRASRTMSARRLTRSLDVRHDTTTRPRLGATVNDRTPCLDCIPWSSTSGRRSTEELKATAALRGLRNRPDTVFEVGETELNGQKMIYTYQVGISSARTTWASRRARSANGYTLYYNDGINQIRVVAQYKDDRAVTRGHAEARAARRPRDDRAGVPRRVYTHAW